ncbi:MAG: carbohydrate porin [Deltaproteobacteria bacterium]|nr:MAG: carbohydrate porin [Deltaproteobacteria bacterium]
MKQTNPTSVNLLRILTMTACVVAALIVTLPTGVGDIYASESGMQEMGTAGQTGASGDASSGDQQEGGILPVPDYSGDLRTRPALTGDWGGRRQQWADKGAIFRFDWYQAVQGVVDGGINERWAYETNLDLYVDLDLDRMGVIPGGLVAFRAQSRFGDTVNGDSGLLLPVNTYGAFPLTDPPDENVPFALTELNYTQFLSEHVGLLVGKITTMKNANEFAGGEGRTQFMNFQFIFPAVYAQLAPYSTLAAGVVWMPSEPLQFTSILMNTADSSTTTGFDDIGEGTTWWNSVDVQWNLGGRPGGSTLGFLYAFDGNFVRVGGINFDPIIGGIVFDRESEAWALRLDGWQYLFTETEPDTRVDARDGRQDLQGVGVFASFGLGDEDTNPVSWATFVGLSGRGVIPGRDDDTMGVGYFYNRLQAPRPILNNLLSTDTQGIEAYYNVAVLRSTELTFDFQWTDPAVPRAEDALLLGFRLNVSF